MQMGWRIGIIMGIALSAGCAGTAVRAARGTWHEAKTGRFSVLTDGDPEQAREWARDLERVHAVMLKMTTFEERHAAPPLRVVLTSNHSSYSALGGPKGSGGVFKSSSRGNFALVSLRTDGGCSATPSAHGHCGQRAADRNEAARILFHEYVHNLEAQAGSRTPSWYKEGLAEYMGATEFRDDGSYTIGCPDEARMAWMKHHDWVPMDQLMTADVIAAIPGHYTNTYGQAWAAVHYFSADKARAAQLDQYLALWGAETDHGQMVEQAFGMTPDELNAVLNEYARQENFRCLEVSPEALAAVPEPELRELKGGEARFRVAELLYSTVGPTDAVFDLLEEAHRLAPEDWRALAALARAHWARGEQTAIADEESSAPAGERPLPRTSVEKSLNYLQQALQTGSGAPYVAVIEGQIRAGQAAREARPGDAARSEYISQARKAYRRAIKADETLAEAYYGLGSTYLLEDNGSKEPIVVLEAASYLLPLAVQVPITLARVRIARGQHAEAEAPLRYAVAWSEHSDLHAVAKRLLQQAQAAQPAQDTGADQ